MRQEIESFGTSELAVQAVDAVNIDLQIELLAPVRRGLYPACPKLRCSHLGGSAIIASEPDTGNLLDYVLPFVRIAYMLKSGNSLTMVKKTGGHRYISVLVNRDIFRQSPLSSLPKG